VASTVIGRSDAARRRTDRSIRADTRPGGGLVAACELLGCPRASNAATDALETVRARSSLATVGAGMESRGDRQPGIRSTKEARPGVNRYLPSVRNQPRTRSGIGIDQARVTAAQATERELRDAYAAAVSHGARNTRCTADEERAYGTLRLLTLVMLRLPDLFLYAHVAQAFCEDPEVDRVPAVVVDGVRVIAAGALRLAHRALEMHASETGCEHAVWVDRALGRAGAWLARPADADVPALLEHARRAAIALTRATSATADDRTQMPAELADGVARLLAVYVIATTVACSGIG